MKETILFVVIVTALLFFFHEKPIQFPKEIHTIEKPIIVEKEVVKEIEKPIIVEKEIVKEVVKEVPKYIDRVKVEYRDRPVNV
jgi:hypothetical protein